MAIFHCYVSSPEGNTILSMDIPMNPAQRSKHGAAARRPGGPKLVACALATSTWAVISVGLFGL